MSVKASFFPFNQGEDHSAPAIQRDPSLLRASENYELGVSGGFRRIDGYERYDGHPSPSKATYSTITFTGGSGFSVGDFVTGSVSGATGSVIGATITTGAYGSSNATGQLSMASVAGAFIIAEALLVAAVAKGTTSSVATVNSSPTDVLHTINIRAAEELARSKIAAVPGSGAVRGVWLYNGVAYAFRDNVAGTACTMFKQSVAGWVAVTTPALAPGGRYEFFTYNFGGLAATKMMFGCDGVNKAFQFDGTTFTQITTAMVADTPRHITAHKNHLFLSFGASVQHSSISDPLVWSPITGAGEIAMGDTVTGFMPLPGGVLAIFSRNRTSILNGSSAADWLLSPFSLTTGAIEHSIQRLADTFYLDDRGVTHLQATQAFGNFSASTLTQGVQVWLSHQMPSLTASVVVRNKNQMRLFFSDGTAMVMKFGDSQGNAVTGVIQGSHMIGITRSLFPQPVSCICSQEDNAGREILLYGSSNGFVYQMDSGTSFDGAPIAAFVRLPFYHYGSPSQRKRFRKIMMEVEAVNPIAIQFQPELSYGSSTDISASISVAGSGGFWDVAAWDAFKWSGQLVETAVASINGTGVNMGLLIYTSSTYNKPHILQGMTVHYSMRRQER
ncbi:MAG: hypothetical protein R8K20_11920 [Gallionellaceae bacterium]